ncbi:MAG TPA: IS110 family transposase [Polyangiales bacterium]|nr:IS110 family transposase [Polyangiales bacterium]
MKNKPNKRDRRRRAVLKEAGLQQVHLNAAGIDIGSEWHWVAVPEGRDQQHVRSFPSFTSGLTELADWLQRCDIDTVAMESTGVYWIPLYELLQSRGFTVLLVNARHVKNVPGRKDDCLDCQWLQKLHTFGLLRGSFRPDAEITALRCCLRQRETIVIEAATWVQRMQKALTQMNLQLQHVLSDISGTTGLAILRDIVAGERDPERLARHRDRRCRASMQMIIASLTGSYRDEHLFALRQALQAYDFFQQQLRDCDRHVEQLLRSITTKLPIPPNPPPTPRSARAPRNNDFRFEARSPLYTLTGGIDITQLPGISPHNGLRLLSEIGTDMKRFKTEKHFVSWLTLSPHVKASGGRVLSSRTQPSANRAAKLLRISVVTLRRSDTALGAFYRRLAARIGKPKAVTATARKLAILLYRALTGQLKPEALDARHYEEQQRERAVRSLHRRAKSLGFQLIQTPDV